MASYKVEIKKSAQKEIRKLPSKDIRVRIINKIDDLSKDPTPNEAKKIKGSNNIYRIRQGAYRIVYQVFKNKLVIMIIRVRHRKDAYKDL